RLARGSRIGEECAGVVAAEVPHVAVVGVARVGALHVGGDREPQGTALGVGGVDDFGAALVEAGTVAAAAPAAAAVTAASGEHEGGRRTQCGESHGTFVH